MVIENGKDKLEELFIGNTYEQIEYMRKSGLTSVMFGVESGSQRMLDIMIKKVKREDYIKSAQVLGDLGIEMYASFMFVPRETIDDLKQSIKLMHEIKKVNPSIAFTKLYFFTSASHKYVQRCNRTWVSSHPIHLKNGLKEASVQDLRKEMILHG